MRCECDLAGLRGVDAYRLFDPEGLASLDCCQSNLMVQEVGGRDRDRVDLGIREQVAVVFVCPLKAENIEGVFACVGAGSARPRRFEPPRSCRQERCDPVGTQLLVVTI